MDFDVDRGPDTFQVKLVQPHRDPRRWHWRQGAHGTLYSYAPVPGPKHRQTHCPDAEMGVAWQLRGVFLVCTGGIIVIDNM